MVPVTVSVALKVPAAIVVGLTLVIAGPTTVTFAALDIAPPGFSTAMFRVEALPSRLPGRVAVMDVAVAAVTVNCVGDELLPDTAA